MSPGECSHAGQQLGQCEGFGQVVVGPGVEALHPILHLAAGGKHQDGDMYVRRPKGPHDLHPAALGEHPVDDEEVEGVLQGAREAGAPFVGRLGHVPLLAQDTGEGASHLLLVFYDQDPWHLARILAHLSLSRP